MRGELGFPRPPPGWTPTPIRRSQRWPGRVGSPQPRGSRPGGGGGGGGVSSTHPSPTTTHLMACIGAAARSGRAWAEGKALRGLGLSLGLRLLPPLEGTAVRAPREGRGGRQRRERRRQRPPPKARGGRLRRARRKQEAAAPLTSGRERSRARTTAPSPPLSLSGAPSGRPSEARRTAPEWGEGRGRGASGATPPAPGVRGRNRFGTARVARAPRRLGSGSGLRLNPSIFALRRLLCLPLRLFLSLLAASGPGRRRPRAPRWGSCLAK